MVADLDLPLPPLRPPTPTRHALLPAREGVGFGAGALRTFGVRTQTAGHAKTTAVTGRDAITLRDDGTPDVPETLEEWAEWVSASRTRNWCLQDPLLDWLDLHGQAKGFARDDEAEGFDERCDFLAFVFEKGKRFEEHVVDWLDERHDLLRISRHAEETDYNRALWAAEQTWEAMAAGREIIAQAVLRNPQDRTFGAADLAVRSDVLRRLFPGALSAEEAARPAPALEGAGWHYRAVDVKFTTLPILKDGRISGTKLEYAAQVQVYNAALGRLQGWTPPLGYLLGRGWKSGSGQNREGSSSAVDRLAHVDPAIPYKNKPPLAQIVDDACDWIRRVRRHGAGWDVVPTPSVPELYPNMSHTEDAPWHGAKAAIAKSLEELTLLPRVGVVQRQAAHQRGLTRWSDAGCSSQSLGITTPAYAPRLDIVLEANRARPGTPAAIPPRLTVSEDEWREPVPGEFYVDFETVTSLDDDFTRFPEQNGRPLITMIGCGQLADPLDPSSWQFEVFTLPELTKDAERETIGKWITHVAQQCAREGVPLERARLFHWSHAERSSIGSPLQGAAQRHSQPTWARLPWVDLLTEVVRAQPMGVRGAFGFGLKSIARALRSAGHIQTSWDDGPVDGLGAMVGTWWCAAEAERTATPMTELPLMKEIERYNEVDCRVMAEILAWLRKER